jgi:hypothetical protein
LIKNYKNRNLIFLTIIILAIGLRLFSLNLKEGFSYDESITLLDSSGNTLEYYSLFNPDSPFFNQTTSKGDIAEYVDIVEPYNFSDISSGILKSDLNSPLYYWILNIIYSLFGISIYGGTIVNIILTLLIGIVLYFFVLKSSNRTYLALGSTAIFLFSPAVLHISLESRSLALYGLFTILYAIMVYKICWKQYLLSDYLILGLIGFLGLTNQFFFITVIAGGGLFILIIQGFRKWKQLGAYTITVIVSCIVSFLVFPVYQSLIATFQKSNSMASGVQATLIEKVKTTVYACLEFFAAGHYMRYIALLFLVTFTIVLAGKITRNKFKINKKGMAFFGLFFAFWNAITMTIPYLIGIIPPAVGEQYFMHTWPFLALLTTCALIYLKTPKLIISTYISLLLISSATSINSSPYVDGLVTPSFKTHIKNKKLVFLVNQNSPNRGYIPRILFELQDDQSLLLTDKHIGNFSNNPQNYTFINLRDSIFDANFLNKNNLQTDYLPTGYIKNIPYYYTK